MQGKTFTLNDKNESSKIYIMREKIHSMTSQPRPPEKNYSNIILNLQFYINPNQTLK